MQRKTLVLAALLPLAAACSDSTGPERAGQVAVRFNTASSVSASTSVSNSGAPFSTAATAAALSIAGENGTLVIEDIRLIVSEIELERAEGACVSAGDGDECEEFKGGPFLVNLLDGSADQVVSAMVPAGSYMEFEFEVENLDADGDDSPAEQQTIQALLSETRQVYPNFPSNASMVVKGTFNGEPFTVYFDAEIEVEREFASPFRVPEDGAITVNLDPALWFKSGTQVMNLTALNGQTVAFEAEFENGVLEVEFDD